MNGFNAGKLNVKIDIQSKTISQDPELNSAETWTNFKTGVWAQSLDKTTREFYRLSTNNSEITQVFRIRYKTGITAHMRIKFRDRYLEIIGDPINEGERNAFLLISCKGMT